MPIFQHFDPNRISVVEANLFNYITRGILSQYNKDGVLYPIITDLINRIVQVLKKDLYWVKISTQNIGLMEPVKL